MKIFKASSPLENATHGSYKKQMVLNDNDMPHIYELGRVIMKKGDSAQDHLHDGRYEIFLIEKGKARIVFNKTEEKIVEAGDFIITNSDESHQVSNPFDEDLVLVFLEIKP